MVPIPDFPVHPTANEIIYATDLAAHFERQLAAGNRVHTGLQVSAGAGLNVSIAIGIAIIKGKMVGRTTGSAVTKSVTDNQTNHVYLKANGDIEVNITGIAPTDSVKLGEPVASGGSVTGVTDRRDFGVSFDAAVTADAFEANGADPYLKGGYASLSQGQPYVRLQDTNVSGLTARIYSRSGKWEVTSDAGTVYVSYDPATSLLSAGGAILATRAYADAGDAAVAAAASSALATHAALTSTHGVSGAIVGTTDVQTLTNKTLTTPTIGSFANAAHNHQDAAGGGTLSITAATTGTLSVDRGGTGFASYTVGDILYASTATAFSKLAGVATGNALISGGVGAAPSWGKITLTGHVSGTLPVANGGTGLASYTVGDIIYASGATALSALAGVVTGNVLISGGVTTAPSWGKVGLTTHVNGTLGADNGGTGNASYTVGDILYASGATTLSKLAGVATGNVLISGGLSTAPSWGKVGLTTHVSGTLPVANGGTGLASYTIGDIIYASGATTLAALADVATGNALISGGVGTAPSWGKIGLTTHVSGTLPAANGGTGQASYTVGDLLYASGATTLSKLAAVASGQVLASNGVGAAPSWTAGPTLSTLRLTGNLTHIRDIAYTFPSGQGTANTFLRNDGSGNLAWASAAMSWATYSGTSISGAANNGYVLTHTALQTINLPSSPAVGDTIEVVGQGSGGWKVQCASGHWIQFGDVSSASTGYVESSNRYDTVRLTYAGGSAWHVTAAVGVLNLG